MQTYYVQATISGTAAACSYFNDYECKEPAKLPLKVSQTAGFCAITQGAGSALQLVASVFKTIDNPTGLTAQNYAAAIGQTVFVPMPVDRVVTKGVVLLFAPPDVVTTLYASADPQVQNDGG